MFDLIFSFTGFIFGIILSLIAPEEIKAGEKYFFFIQKTIFILIFLTVNLYLYLSQQHIIAIVYSIISIFIFLLYTRIYSDLLEIPTYLLFITSYFLNPNPLFHLLITSFIFLYGLPTGTIVRTKLRKKQHIKYRRKLKQRIKDARKKKRS